MKTTPQEEWEDVLYKFTLGSLHLSLEKRHDWYKSFIKSEKEKSRQEVLREVGEIVRTTENLDIGIQRLNVDYKDGYLDAKNDIRVRLSTLESKE